MAEDNATANDLTTDEEKSRPQTAASGKKKQQTRPTSGSRPKSRPKTSDTQKTKCRSRIDQLAIPSRRLILALYQDHANHLERDRVERIKVLLQELYAMTPEETEKYFEHLRNNAREVGRKKDIKYMLKKLLQRRRKAKQVKKAYEFINRLVVQSMNYAIKNPVPPLVSVRLRNLSNIILEQVCDLRNINIPNRDNPDPVGALLIQIADWMAIAIEHLYYGVQLKKNKELEKIEHDAKIRETEMRGKSQTEASKVSVKDKTKSSKTENEEGESDGAVISEPLLVSEME